MSLIQLGELPLNNNRHLPLLKRRRVDLFPDNEFFSDANNARCQFISNQVTNPISLTTTPKRSRSRPSTPRPKPYVCKYEHCGKAFTRPCRLEEHNRSHTKERPFACPEPGCGKCFFRSTHLSHHVKNAHSNERNYDCDWPGCEKAFATGTRLRRHQRAHEEKNKFRCKDYTPCSQTFRKQATLDKHVSLVHLNQKPFLCGYVTDEASRGRCQHAFESTYKLELHRGRVHSVARYWCTLCISEKAGSPNCSDANGEELAPSTGFATNALLQAHIEATHPPICTHCNRSFASARGLRSHHETAHDPDITLEDRRKFCCDVLGCARSFTRKSNLETHVRALHAPAQNLVCGEATNMDEIVKYLQVHGPKSQFIGCGATFASRKLFLAHVRTVHLATAKAAEHGYSRKSLRKAKKENKKIDRSINGQNSVSALQRLTGVANPENMNNWDNAIETPINMSYCVVVGCSEVLTDDRELQLHMASSHLMTEDEIQVALLETRALTGGTFWISAAERGVDSISPWGRRGFVDDKIVNEDNEIESERDEDDEKDEGEEEATRMLDAQTGIDNQIKAIELGSVLKVY